MLNRYDVFEYFSADRKSSLGIHVPRYFKIIFLWLLMMPGLASASNVVSFELPNGLKLFVQEDHRAPVVVSQVWYKVGSSYEPNGITGISHALEHMMFKGTPTHGPGQFSHIIAENGGDENAFTDRDFTAYYQVMDASKLPISFELEADRMRHLTIDPAEFAKEIQVVMEERRMRYEDNPQMLTYERFVAAGYISSPYHHTPIGWMNDLQNMTAADLRAWYEKWYAPNNALVVVVGDVNPNEVFKLAQKYFGPLKPSVITPVKPQLELTSLGQRRVNVQVPAQMPWMIMGYLVPSIKSTDMKNMDPYVLAVIAAILDGGNSGWLQKDLVRGQQIAADISVDYDPFTRLTSMLKINGTPAQGHTTAELIVALLAEIKKLKEVTVTPEELARVKAQVIAAKEYNKDSISDQASEIGSLEAVGLPWQLRDEYIKKISEVNAKQIQEVANRYFTGENLTIGELKPLPLPSGKTPAPAIQGTDSHVH